MSADHVDPNEPAAPRASRPPGGPDDQQLIRLVHHLAKLHLEIERGVRDPDQFVALMKPAAQLVWNRIRATGGSLPGGPATEADLGPVHLRRTGDGTVLATLTTATLPGRRAALTFVLHIDRDRVWVRQAQRLLPGRNYGGHPRGQQPKDEHYVLGRLDAARQERDAVLAALDANQRLAAESATGRRRGPSAASWRKVLHELDTEITSLMRNDIHRHFAEDGLRRHRGAGSKNSP